MANKIDGLEVRPIRVSAGTSVRKSGDAGAGRTGQGGASGMDADVDVHITSSARNLAALEQSVQDMPAIDSARVDEIQRRLAEGRYQIDPQRIADAFLRREDELTGLSRK